MKIGRTFFGACLLMLSFSATATAGDFDWMKDFNVRAEADRSGFKAKLGTRFSIGEAEVSTVIDNIKIPSDVYMVLRLAEMAKLPSARVMSEYKPGKGWGVVAKNLGIKPGSPEFHALKGSQDLYIDFTKEQEKAKGKGRKKK